MQFTSLLARFRRPLALFALVASTFSTAPQAAAQFAGAADIAPASLPGKTLVLNATNAGSPFVGTGIFSIVFTGTTYTMPIGAGNPTFYSGAYTATVQGGNTVIRLAGYLVGGSPVTLELVPSAASLIPGAFEMYADGVQANKRGSFTINGSSTGGGGTGNPAITSQTQVAATVGQPFVYQITTSPAATSYTNTGGNAPVAISPGSGIVTGTFTQAGTFNFSFTATNASGTSAVTTVTVTATAGSTNTLAITSPTTATATVGSAFSYQGTSTPASTLWTNLTVTPTAPISLNADTGQITGTFPAPGTYTLAFNSANLTGGSPRFTLTVTVTGTAPVVNISTYAGTYTGVVFQIRNGFASILGGASYSTVITPAGAVTTTITNAGASTTLTGTINAAGAITYTGGTGATTTIATAPTNLVGYRNKVGGVYQFTVTGVARGAVWGTDVYTDDSTVAAAAVHAGVLAAGETKTVTVTILPGQASYPASTRNGVSSASWGSWAGSYSFAGAGAVSTVPVATARPAVAPGFVATTTALAAGGRLVCPITVTGGGVYTYRWYLNGNLISGATVNPYVVDSLTAANAGTYSVDVTNSLGTTRLTAGTVNVGNAGSPVLALQPISKTVVPGATFTLAANASGSGLGYQWFRNNVALSGETGAILLRNNANAADSGNYTVRI
jgi:hypothetical protein